MELVLVVAMHPRGGSQLPFVRMTVSSHRGVARVSLDHCACTWPSQAASQPVWSGYAPNASWTQCTGDAERQPSGKSESMSTLRHPIHQPASKAYCCHLCLHTLRCNQAIVRSGKQLEGIRAACRAGREVLDLAAAAVRPGVTTDELDRIVHEATIVGARGVALGSEQACEDAMCIEQHLSVQEAGCKVLPSAYETCSSSNPCSLLLLLSHGACAHRNGGRIPLRTTTSTSPSPCARLSTRSSATAFPTQESCRRGTLSTLMCQRSW